jgi:hypothetical protein
MRIEQSHVDFSAREAYAERRERRDRLRVDVRPAPAPAAASAASSEPVSFDGDARLSLARLIIERLLGGRFARATASSVARSAGAGQAALRSAPSWNVTFTHTEVYEETESLTVKARGAVRTAVGVEIRFDAEFSLARRYVEESGFTLRAGNANLSDPLFLETSGGLALLVDDADSDGQVSGEAELFGARTGDGFAELGRLDSDANGWIDSADPVFARLRLRVADGALQSLADAQIGALSVSAIDGQFQYKDSANELVAVVRRTGVYLTESGAPGAVRQIDLAL